MNNKIIYNTAQIEKYAQKGAEIISSFYEETIKRINFLEEQTINGKYYNSKLNLLNEELFTVNSTLKKYLLEDNNVNVFELKRFLEYVKLYRPITIKAVNDVFNDIKCDNDDKETCHKYITIYDQLVSTYENLLMKLSLKNIALRTALNKGELKLEKIEIKKKYSTVEIEKIMNEFVEVIKKNKK
jgi:hypothetical protein